jgi:hypothetical protein
LGTLGNPVINALGIDLQTDFTATGDRVKETDALNKAAITGIAAVGHDYTVERTLLGTTAGETNNYHYFSTLVQSGFPAHDL